MTNSTSDAAFNIDDKRMSKRWGVSIFFVINLLGVALSSLTAWLGFEFASVFSLDPNPALHWLILYGFIIWFSIAIAWGLRIVPKMEFLVVERFGKFYRIAHDGPTLLLLPGLIDQTRTKDGLENTLAYQQMPLYEGEETTRIDFTDGSAPIIASVWVVIGSLEKVGGLQRVEAVILRFIYKYKDPASRAEQILDGTLRPLLQVLTIEKAGITKTQIAEDVTNDPDVRKSLEDLGLSLDPTRGLVISDIRLSEAQIELRRKQLDATTEAAKIVAEAGGFAEAIKKICDILKVSKAKAEEIWREQRAQQSFKDSGARVSFVAPNLKGVVNTLQVEDVAGGQGQ